MLVQFGNKIGLRPHPILTVLGIFLSNYFQIGQHVVLLHVQISHEVKRGPPNFISRLKITSHTCLTSTPTPSPQPPSYSPYERTAFCLGYQGHLRTVSCKISFWRSKYCLEIAVT